MDWAERIRRVRKRLDLNQTEFGQLLNVHFVTVSNWERGVHDPEPCVQIIVPLLETHPTQMQAILSEPLQPSVLPWAERIKNIRERMGLSQENFARALGFLWQRSPDGNAVLPWFRAAMNCWWTS